MLHKRQSLMNKTPMPNSLYIEKREREEKRRARRLGSAVQSLLWRKRANERALLFAFSPLRSPKNDMYNYAKPNRTEPSRTYRWRMSLTFSGRTNENQLREEIERDVCQTRKREPAIQRWHRRISNRIVIASTSTRKASCVVRFN